MVKVVSFELCVEDNKAGRSVKRFWMYGMMGHSGENKDLATKWKTMMAEEKKTEIFQSSHCSLLEELLKTSDSGEGSLESRQHCKLNLDQLWLWLHTNG